MASGRIGSNYLSEIIGWERPFAINLTQMVVAAMMRRSCRSFKVGAPSGGYAGSLGRDLAPFPYSDPLFVSFHSFFNSLNSLFHPFPFLFRIQT
jgi:hypothetical protein